MVLKNIVEIPAPTSINQGIFLNKSLTSALSDVFSVIGLMRSRVHRKVEEKDNGKDRNDNNGFLRACFIIDFLNDDLVYLYINAGVVCSYDS